MIESTPEFWRDRHRDFLSLHERPDGAKLLCEWKVWPVQDHFHRIVFGSVQGNSNLVHEFLSVAQLAGIVAGWRAYLGCDLGSETEPASGLIPDRMGNPVDEWLTVLHKSRLMNPTCSWPVHGCFENVAEASAALCKELECKALLAPTEPIEDASDEDHEVGKTEEGETRVLKVLQAWIEEGTRRKVPITALTRYYELDRSMAYKKSHDLGNRVRRDMKKQTPKQMLADIEARGCIRQPGRPSAL